MKTLLDEFIEEINDLFLGQEKVSEIPENKGVKGGAPYPDFCANRMGGTDEEVEEEVSKMLGCDRTSIKLLGVLTGADYYKFISCMRWFCLKCGSHGGRIHKRRLARIKDNLEGLMEGIVLRQFIFTIPKEWRANFQSRKGMNAFIRICENVMNKKFPGKRSIAYFHAFGDEESQGVFHPHVNIHVIEESGGLYKLSVEELRDIKKALWKGLHGYIKAINPAFNVPWKDAQGIMNFKYSFVQDKERIMHRLKYMARLHPHSGDFKFIRSSSLARLFIVEMKGFNYIRYFNGFNHQVCKDVDRKGEIKEAIRAAREPLRIIVKGGLTRKEFDMEYKNWDYEEIADGLFRIRGSEEKKKKKEVKGS